MTIPKLFYIGLLGGLVSRIPGMDFGTMILAFGMNEVVLNPSLKKTFKIFLVIVLGFLTTQFLPLWKLEIFFYREADLVLSFIFGIVVFSAGHIWLHNKNALSKMTILKTALLIVFGIFVKAIEPKIFFTNEATRSILQGFFILIPGFDYDQNVSTGISMIKILVGFLGLLLSIILLNKVENSDKDWTWLKVGLLIIGLCDFWPWRAFQHYLYLGDGARWLNDFPILPQQVSILEFLVISFFCFLGALCSWSVNKLSHDKVDVTFS